MSNLKANEETEACVLIALDGGAVTFTEVCSALGVDPKGADEKPAWRAVDRALQRLRKRGVVAWAKGRWSRA